MHILSICLKKLWFSSSMVHCCFAVSKSVCIKVLDMPKRIHFYELFFMLIMMKQARLIFVPITGDLQEDIIILTSGVTSHYIVLHPVSSRGSRTSGLCVQFIHHSWLVDYRNI